MQGAKLIIDTLNNHSQLLKTLLKKVDKLDNQSNLNKDYLTTQEACTFLGCSRSMIWKLVNVGKLNRLKMENGRTYYASAELKKLIENPQEIEDAA